MPYPESCPACGGPFRNTGTHFTARRAEVGRRVLLELGCQNAGTRYWWDFGAGQPAPRGPEPAAANARNGHAAPALANAAGVSAVVPAPDPDEAPARAGVPEVSVAGGAEARPVGPPDAVRDAFLRQLRLDRMTLRQVRSWLLADDARHAAQVAAAATEATYERLALALFGADLTHLAGLSGAVAPSATLSAEERLELQREKARVRARQRRAALKAAHQSPDPAPA